MRALLLEIWEGLQIAFRAIWTHKLRAVLTTLGIIIGITAVTAMATIINGIDRSFEESLSAMGTDVLYVQKWPAVMGPGSKWWEYINRPDITADLARVIEEKSRYAVAAAPVVDTRRALTYRGQTITGVTVEGSGADYPRVRGLDLARGRFFTGFEARSAENVGVIGAEVAEKLFPAEVPLGKSIRVGVNEFRIIGVLERQGTGSEGGSSADTQIKIPFSTFERFFGARRRNIEVQVKVASTDVMERAAGELTGILRVARGLGPMEENDFEVIEQDDIREQIAPVKTAIYGVGIFLTALSLLVGGIGVMNIMFVSVKERTKEIGLRKAVGARRRTILTQFLIEAVILCLLGGAIGAVLSSTLTGLIRATLGIAAFLPMRTVALAFFICTLVGVAFGLAPAWQAAKADPIEALRYE